MNIIKNLADFGIKNSPVIAVALGTAGLISAGIAAVAVTPRYLDDINSKPKDISGIDKLKVGIKHYGTPVAMTAVSTACIISGMVLNHHRHAAVVTAYIASDTALKTYQNKVTETIGPKKELAIRDSIAKDKLDKTPMNNEVLLLGEQKTLYLDARTGRYFEFDIESMKQLENKLNHRLLRDDFISVNDFYYEVDLEPIKDGFDLGWRADGGYIDFQYSAHIARNGKPCIVLTFATAPKIY